jgi:uncharacterized damage-inducible protein DinB
MTEAERILDQLRRAYDGDAWYGSSVRTIVGDVTAERAMRRPVADAHCIWEIVLHMTGWKREVANRLRGAWAGSPEEGDWPLVTDTSEAAWRAALDRLDRAHRELLDAAAAIAPSRLGEPSKDRRDRAAGTGVSLYVLLHGIVQHDVYHSGQIALLNKAR